MAFDAVFAVLVAVGPVTLHAQEPPKNVARVPAPAQFEPSPIAVNLVQVDAVIRATQARQQFNFGIPQSTRDLSDHYPLVDTFKIESP